MRAMNAKILVVDDDTALAEMIGIVLRAEGFDLAFCADGAEALEAFRASNPDLVLLDLMLPGVNGIQVCASIREESGVPIIMLTAKSDTADVVRAEPMTTSSNPSTPKSWWRASALDSGHRPTELSACFRSVTS
jgi:CheY-like chemotaxis protein